MKDIPVGGIIAPVTVNLLDRWAGLLFFPIEIKLRGPTKMSGEFEAIIKMFFMKILFIFVQKGEEAIT